MITLDTLNHWLTTPAETENLEFKAATEQFDTVKTLRYCVALANEKGGYLVLGVTDKAPRRVIGTKAFLTIAEQNKIKEMIVQKLRIRVETTELDHPDGRVLVFEIPSRADGYPIEYEGAYLMRAGEALVPMTPDQLRRIFAEGQPDWFSQYACEGIDNEKVIALLDTQSYFDLLKLPYPTTQDNVLA